jgi:hypothetical protein
MNKKINIEPILVAILVLIVNTIAWSKIKNLPVDEKLIYGIGITLCLRFISVIYASIFIRKCNENLSFWAFTVFFFPVIGLIFMCKFSPESNDNIDEIENDVNSVNNPDVLDEIIERFNSKKNS